MENNLKGEIWKPVPGYGNHYEASNLGRVRVKDRIVERLHHRSQKIEKHYYKGRLLSPNVISRLGHLAVHIGVNGEKFSVCVHKLVLLAFHGMPKQGQECCHNNGFAWCNRPGNLRWDTHLENNRDRLRHGTYYRGEDHHYATIKNETAMKIKYSQLATSDAAKKYGVGYKKAWRIRTGQTWRHI